MAIFRRLYRDIFHLRHPDADGANRFKQKLQPLLAQRLSGGEQMQVFLTAEIPRGIPEHPPLYLDEFDPALLPAQKAKQAVDGGEFGIDRNRRELVLQQPFLLPGNGFLYHQSVSQPRSEGEDVTAARSSLRRNCT